MDDEDLFAIQKVETEIEELWEVCETEIRKEMESENEQVEKIIEEVTEEKLSKISEVK